MTTNKDAEEGNIQFIFWIQCIEQETFYYDLCSESFSNLCFSDVDLEPGEEEAWLRRRRSGAATKGGFLVRPVNHRRTALANWFLCPASLFLQEATQSDSKRNVALPPSVILVWLAITHLSSKPSVDIFCLFLFSKIRNCWQFYLKPRLLLLIIPGKKIPDCHKSQIEHRPLLQFNSNLNVEQLDRFTNTLASRTTPRNPLGSNASWFYPLACLPINLLQGTSTNFLYSFQS